MTAVNILENSIFLVYLYIVIHKVEIIVYVYIYRHLLIHLFFYQYRYMCSIQTYTIQYLIRCIPNFQSPLNVFEDINLMAIVVDWDGQNFYLSSTLCLSLRSFANRNSVTRNQYQVVYTYYHKPGHMIKPQPVKTLHSWTQQLREKKMNQNNWDK